MEEHKHHDGHHHKEGFQEEAKKHLNDAVDTFKEIQHPGKFDLGKEFKNAIEVIKLNSKKMHEISTRKTTATAAFLFILIGALAMSLGTYLSIPGLYRPSVIYLLISLAFNVALPIVTIFVMDFVASKFFKGKGNFSQLFRVLGYGYILMIVGLIPAILPLASLWYLVVTYKALETVKKVNPTHNVFTIIISALAVGLVTTILASVFSFGLWGFYGVNPTWFY